MDGIDGWDGLDFYTSVVAETGNGEGWIYYAESTVSIDTLKACIIFRYFYRGSPFDGARPIEAIQARLRDLGSFKPWSAAPTVIRWSISIFTVDCKSDGYNMIAFSLKFSFSRSHSHSRSHILYLPHAFVYHRNRFL